MGTKQNSSHVDILTTVAGIIYAQLPPTCNTSNVDAHFSAFAYLKQLFAIISCFEDQMYKHIEILEFFYSKFKQIFLLKNFEFNSSRF
jgi:hypothetical protein